MLSAIKSTLLKIQQKKPLILCLTNSVTVDFVANSLLAIGAAPVMSEAKEEIEELVTLCSAVYINIGTLNNEFMKRALWAAEIASYLNKPIILDPVGAGASQLRTTAAQDLLPFANIVRGNASEIISLNGATTVTKGVETTAQVANAISSAQSLAKNHHKTIVISGPEDFVTDSIQARTLRYGSQLMPLITGMGCTMTAILAAFNTENTNHFQAALQATAYFGLCGQITHQHATTPAAFKSAFIDNLYAPNWELLTQISTEDVK